MLGSKVDFQCILSHMNHHIGYWDLKSVQTYPLKTALLTFYYVKQPFSGPDLSVLEGMKCPFLDFTYLLMC